MIPAFPGGLLVIRAGDTNHGGMTLDGEDASLSYNHYFTPGSFSTAFLDYHRNLF
jgi:hypothetical protein